MSKLDNQQLHLLSEWELIEYYRVWKTANPIAHVVTYERFRDYITPIDWSDKLGGMFDFETPKYPD